MAAAPVRRSAPRVAVREEEEHESMGVRAALILCSILMVCALPVIYSISSDTMTSLAELFASGFMEK